MSDNGAENGEQEVDSIRTGEPKDSPASAHGDKREKPSDDPHAKYDLSTGPAHVLVLHHDTFDNSARNRRGSDQDMRKLREFAANYRTVEPLDLHENYSFCEVLALMDAGHVSYRDIAKDSIFMQTFFELLASNDQDISDISRLLNRRLSANKNVQNPPMTSTLCKRFVFGDLRREKKNSGDE